MASNFHTVTFTRLELVGLLARLAGENDDADPTLDIAAQAAIEKLHRAESGVRAPGEIHRRGRGKSIGTLWPRGKPAA